MKRILLYLSLLPALLVSCVNDDSTGVIHQLDALTIQGIDDVYNDVYVGHPLRINPVVESVSGDLSHFEYVWFAYTKDSILKADTLAKQKDLDIEVDLAPGEHTVKFRATDTLTGIFYEKEFTVNVVNDFTTGLMILCQKGEDAVLNFWIPSRDEIVTDVYGRLNGGERLGTRPHRVVFTPYTSSAASEVIVMCQDNEGGRILNSTSMQKNRDYKDLFFNTSTTDICPQNYFISEMREYLIDGNLVYDRATNSNPPDQYVRPAMSVQGGDYEIAENANFGDDLSPVARMVVYDNKNRCFYSLYNITNAYLTTVRKTSGVTYQKGGYFDPDNVGLDCVYANLYSRSESGAREYAGIFRDEAGQTFLLRMGIGFWVEGASPNRYFRDLDCSLLTCPDIAEASVFACGASFPAYMFYAYGSKIYAISLSTGLSQQIYDLSDWGGQFVVDHIEVERGGRHLWLGYRDTAKPADGAGFAALAIQTDGGLRLRVDARHDALDDRIIDFESKY